MGRHIKCHRISFSSTKNRLTRNLLTVFVACFVIGVYTYAEGVCDTYPCLNQGTCMEDVASANNYTCMCLPGYTDENCSTICPQGTYGDNCSETCGIECVLDSMCSHINGECLCTPAFDGAVCDKDDINSTAFLTTPVDGMITENESFTLSCYVNLGEDDVTDVEWHRVAISRDGLPRDVQLLDLVNKYEIVNFQSEGRYTINVLNAVYGDSGEYYCEAYTQLSENLFSRSKSDHIGVNIFVPGQTDRSSSILEDRVRLGETAALSCVFISSLELTMKWQRNGQTISANNRTFFSTVSDTIPGAKVFTSQMNISDIEADDHGYYRCRAFKDMSFPILHFDCEIVFIDIPVLGNQRSQIQSDLLTVDWDIIDDGNDENITCTVGQRSPPNPVFEVVDNETKPRYVTVSPYTTYRIFVVCRNSAGESLPLDFMNQTTLVSVPSIVQAFEVESVGGREVNLDWDAPNVPNGPIDGYILYIVDEYGNTRNRTSMGVNTFLKLTGLTPNTPYIIDIRAFNIKEDDMEKLLSDPATVQFTTEEDVPGMPRNPMTTDMTEDEQECRVTWQPPISSSGTMLKYTVYVQITRHNDDEILKRLNFSTSNTMYTFNKATYPPNRLFRFFVSATNSLGEGDNATSPNLSCSQPVGIPDKPLMPIAPRSDAITLNSFTTILPTYTNNNGPISCFEIIVVQVTDQMTDINDISVPDMVLGYNEVVNQLDVAYRALVFAELPSMITVGGPSGETTTCNTGATVLNAVNGPLTPGGYYTCLVRVYSPTGVNGVVLHQNGHFMPITQLSKEAPNNILPIAAGAGGAGALVLVVIIICGVCCKRQFEKRSPSDVDGNDYVNEAFFTGSHEDGSDENARPVSGDNSGNFDIPILRPLAPTRVQSLEVQPDSSERIYDPVTMTPPQTRKDPPRPISVSDLNPPAVTRKPRATPKSNSALESTSISKPPKTAPKSNNTSQPLSALQKDFAQELKNMSIAKPLNKSAMETEEDGDVYQNAVVQPSNDEKPTAPTRVQSLGERVDSEDVKPTAPTRVQSLGEGMVSTDEKPTAPTRVQSLGVRVNTDDRIYDPVTITPPQTRKVSPRPPSVDVEKPPVVTRKTRATPKPDTTPQSTIFKPSKTTPTSNTKPQPSSGFVKGFSSEPKTTSRPPAVNPKPNVSSKPKITPKPAIKPNKPWVAVRPQTNKPSEDKIYDDVTI